MDYDAYQPWTRLLSISILGQPFEVPENNVLLRCFQYLASTIVYGPWCWNGDCESDRIRFRYSDDAEPKEGLSCQIVVREGMEILEISPNLNRFLGPVLAATQTAATRT